MLAQNGNLVRANLLPFHLRENRRMGHAKTRMLPTKDSVRSRTCSDAESSLRTVAINRRTISIIGRMMPS